MHSTAQNRVFFGQSDSCRQFSKEIGKDSILTMKVIVRCDTLSVIEQVKFEKGMYSRNGTYIEFYDTAFKTIKKSGYFLNGIETDDWKEYYTNGKLKYKGSCKIIKVTKSNSDPNRIWFIDVQKSDTTQLLFTLNVLDSIKKLVQFNYYPPFESKGYMLPEFYTLKNGKWFYYSEAGKLTKKEIYKVGALVSNK
jgi:antitoxin component YwqK of YwqJK toxin-antitoxin module